MTEAALTPAQVDQFENQGFLRVPGAFDEVRVAELLRAIDQVRASNPTQTESLGWWRSFHSHESATNPGSWEGRNMVSADDRFMQLVDLPRILLPMCQILGPGISLLLSHAIVRGRNPQLRSGIDIARLGWHRDLGISSKEMPEPHPRLSIKVAIWLTPLTDVGQGSMFVVPGSHRLVGGLPLDEASGRPYGAIPILADPGDILFFEQRLWHAGSPNLGESPRVCLFLGYGYRWLRPQDYVAFPDELLAAMPPIRRQLLGGAVSQMGYHLPTPEDVPLRTWFEEEQWKEASRSGRDLAESPAHPGRG